MAKHNANTPKTGSTKVRSYDPKNKPADGSAKSKPMGPKVSKMYKPSGNDTPSGPRK